MFVSLNVHVHDKLDVDIKPTILTWFHGKDQ